MVADLQSFNSVVTSILTRFRSSLDVRVARVPSNTYSLSLQKSDENSKRNGFKTLRARNQRQLSCQSSRSLLQIDVLLLLSNGNVRPRVE